MKQNRSYSALCLLMLIFLCCLPVFARQIQNNRNSVNKIGNTNLTRIGNWPFGAANAVAVDTARNIVYLGSGGAVLILDVSNFSHPRLLSDIINTTGLVLDLSYNPQKEHLYVAARYEDFQIWDVHNPTAPYQIIRYELPDPYADPRPPVDNVGFWGNYAILECDFDFVNSIDITDPKTPMWVGAESYMGNPSRDIHVDVEGHVHSAGAQNYVKIYIGPNGSLSGGYSYHLTDGPSIVFGVPDAAFLGYRDYMLIIDTQSYAFPVWSATTVGDAYDIFVQNDHAYLTVDDRLQIYNVEDYSSPFPEGSCVVPDFPRKLQVAGINAYLAGRFAGLRIIDVEKPLTPFELGFYETFSATTDMDRSGDYGYIAELDDGMLVLDLSNLSHPRLVGQYDTPGSAGALEVGGNYAYIADGGGGLRIADISDPLHPYEVGAFDSLNWAREICISGSYAYVVDDIINQPDWIRVFDISDPFNPVAVGGLLMQSDVYSLDASGNYLYAAATEQGMRVLDISDPANLAEVGYFLAPKVFDVKVQGNYAYLAAADWEGGFVTLDISDPHYPVFVSAYNPGGWLHPFDVDVEGEYAYVGDPVGNRFLMLYIGDPANPSLLGSFTMSGSVANLYAQDSLVYVSDGQAGLQIFENALFSTSGAGITWQQQSTGTSEDLWSVCFAGTATGWAAGNNGMIVKTVDGGQTWLQKLSGTQNELFTVFFVDENVGWVGGREGTILKSTDGGENWAPQATGTTDVFRSICFVDEDNGWAVGQNGRILHTSDGGQNWSSQYSGVSDYLLKVHFVDADHGWIAASDEYGRILRTANGGSSWQQIYVPCQEYVYCVYFVGQNTGWAVTTGVQIFKTTDGGDTWVKQYDNPQGPYDVLISVYFLDGNTGWAVGSGGNIVSTTDGGITWEAQTSGVPNYLTSVYFSDRNNGWVAGKEGLVLKAASGATTIGNNNGLDTIIPDEFILFDNYPNPFNSTTIIRYQLPARSEVTLRIYNVLGKEVKTLLNDALPPGVGSVVWDGTDNSGSGVSSGIYFYRLESRHFTENKKMILIK